MALEGREHGEALRVRAPQVHRAVRGRRREDLASEDLGAPQTAAADPRKHRSGVIQTLSDQIKYSLIASQTTHAVVHNVVSDGKTVTYQCTCILPLQMPSYEIVRLIASTLFHFTEIQSIKFNFLCVSDIYE